MDTFVVVQIVCLLVMFSGLYIQILDHKYRYNWLFYVIWFGSMVVMNGITVYTTTNEFAYYSGCIGLTCGLVGWCGTALVFWPLKKTG